MEPRKRGSASPSEAAMGSDTSSTPGADAIFTVWEGSAWSRSRSPPKQGFNWLPGAVVIPRAVLTKRSSASARGDFYARRDRVVVRGGERDDLYRR
jgi:hypothetical protein